MDVYVLNRNFEIIGVLDNYKSFIWAKRYNEAGACDIQVKADVDSIQLLQKGNYILRSDDDEMICRIDVLELDTDVEEGNYLIVGGNDCKKLLNQRVVWQQTNFSGTAENFIRKIINENAINPTDTARKISNLSLGELNGYSDKIEIQSSYDYLDEKVQEICKSYHYGYRVAFRNGKLVVEIYKGVDHSFNQNVNDFVVFSPDFENISTTKYSTDSTNYRSIALICGEGEGASRTKTTLDLTSASGLERYELYVDAKMFHLKLSIPS